MITLQTVNDESEAGTPITVDPVTHTIVISNDYHCEILFFSSLQFVN